MYISNSVADRIKLMAKNKGVSIKKLLADVGLGFNTMSNMKNSMPKADNLARIADYLDCSVDYLLGREEKAAPQEEQQKPNTIKILGRDGSCVERQLTDDQIDLMKRMIGQMPDADDL